MTEHVNTSQNSNTYCNRHHHCFRVEYLVAPFHSIKYSPQLHRHALPIYGTLFYHSPATRPYQLLRAPMAESPICGQPFIWHCARCACDWVIWRHTKTVVSKWAARRQTILSKRLLRRRPSQYWHSEAVTVYDG